MSSNARYRDSAEVYVSGGTGAVASRGDAVAKELDIGHSDAALTLINNHLMGNGLTAIKVLEIELTARQTLNDRKRLQTGR
jgi:hypothetical protein